jgi:hypothetical protein
MDLKTARELAEHLNEKERRKKTQEDYRNERLEETQRINIFNNNEFGNVAELRF